jgi:gliding motility-associated-like protein
MVFDNTTTLTKGTNAYLWSFGDGGSSANVSPSYTYGKDGSYTVKLLATTDKGCKDSLSMTVTVYAQPVADFSSVNQCFGEPLLFDNLTVPASTPEWSFGDGSGSSQGEYEVKLLVRTANCADSVSKTYEVYKKPIAGFVHDSACLGAGISFTNTSYYGNISGYAWEFGDGKGKGTTANPVYTYADTGTYSTVLVVVTDDGCRDTAYGSPVVHPMPETSFTGLDVCLHDTLKLASTSTISTGTIAAQTWEYSDGITGIGQASARKFAFPGTYTVRLTTVSGYGCESSASQEVDIFDVPVANFDVDSVCFGFESRFANGSAIGLGSLASHRWDFGDGETDNVMSPVHGYKSAGTYLVQLIAGSDRGCVDTALAITRIYEKPVAGFTATTVCHGVMTQFADTTGNMAAYAWDFGDGSGSSILKAPGYAYLNPGSYTTTLMVTSGDGCRDTVTKGVTVYQLPVANFEVENHCLGKDFTPEELSLGIINDWSWAFGDGNVSGVQNPLHVYADDGAYVVGLIVTSTDGCQDSVKREVVVWPLPEKDIRPDTVVSKGYEVQLWAKGGERYEWTPADMLDDPMLRKPVAIVSSTTTYTVTITTRFGCVGDTTVTLLAKEDYTLEPSNIMTPDGNGKNDYWIGDKAQYYSDVQVIVFDRWGRVVFTSNAYDNTWGGTSNGKELPDGVYYYIVKVPVERSEYKGSITIFR